MSALAYPPAPWQLSGRAVALVRLVPVERVAPHVPNGLKVVPVLPGRTLSVFFLARYDESSTLSYHECILAPALVRRGIRVGAWISNIYVDNDASLQAGREIWGLPKQLAHFDWKWEERGRVAMTHHEMSFELTSSAARRHWLLPLLGGAFGTREPDQLWFAVRGIAKVGNSDGKLWTHSTPLKMCDLDTMGTIYDLKFRRLNIGVPSHFR